jgi:Protein of unknown function (DUF3108)
MRRVFAVLALLALPATMPAAAESGGESAFDLRYGMYWGGFHVADVSLHYAPEPERYESGLSIETVGLADTLLRYRGTATSQGEKTAADGLLPTTYRFDDDSRSAWHSTEITFDPGTASAIRIEASKRGKARGTDVPPDLWVDVLDPLTAFLRLRRELADLPEGAETAVPVLDGRRRFDMVARIVGRERADLDGGPRDALRVEVTIVPLAGFDQEDWDEAGYGDEGIRLQALISDDDRLIPIQVRTLNAPVNVVFNLDQECEPAGACRTPSG